MAFAGYVSKFKVKWCEELHPSCLASIQLVCGFEICQVVVVGVNNGPVNVANEVWSPGFECVDNGKKFFVVYVSVSLGRIESSGKESDGMELAFLIPLLKNRSYRIGRSIAIYNEGVFELGLSEYGGGADGIF